MANDMLVKEVANISTDVLSELGKLVSAYKDYTETLAAVQKQIEYTKEYKEKQTQTARENLVRKTAGTCDTIRIQLESLENTVNSLDQTLNVADPELMPCVGLLANSPEALPLELIGSVAEKFKGNRLALLALAAVAKENNKSFLEGKAVDGAGAVKQIRNKFDMLADGYPKTLHLLPEVKNDLPSHAREKLRKRDKLVDDHRKEYGCKPTNDQLRRYFGDIQSNTIELARSASTGRIQSLDMSVGEDGECTVGDLLPGTADVEGDVLDRVEQEELRAVLWGTVDTLPEKQAAAIRMRYQQSRTLKQIGEELGCSVEMARTHERKALRELRKPSRAKKLKPFFPEADRQRIYSRAISGTGLTSFEHSWTSATERAALQEL